MKNNTSARITLWVSRILAATVILLCFFLKDLLVWYRELRQLPWQVCTAIMTGFCLCVPAVLYALWSVERLLRNVLREQIFVPENVRRIRRIRWCCAWVSLVCLAAGILYPPLLFLAVIMAFLALVVSVVKNVMAAAVELREEHDLTI